MLVNLSERFAAAAISGALKICFTFVERLSNLSTLEGLESAAAWLVTSMKVVGRHAHQDTITSVERHTVLVDLETFIGSDGEVGHNTASILTAGIGVQASGRVDVPGGVPQPAAASHERLGHSGDTKRIACARMKKCKFPVFLRSLDGHTNELEVHESEKVSQVKQRISVCEGT